MEEEKVELELGSGQDMPIVIPELMFNGRKMSLEMLNDENVTSVTFTHPSLAIEVKERGLLGALGHKRKFHVEKETTVKDKMGIKFQFNSEKERITLCFGDKKAWHKVKDYDHDVIGKGISFAKDHCYRVSLPLANIKNIS